MLAPGSTRAATLCSVLLFAALSLLGSAAARAGAFPVVIDNDTIALGVDTEACLNVDTSISAPGRGPTSSIVGLRDLGTGLEGASGGEPYEGWGIADLNSNWSGGATSLVNGGSPFNLTRVGFDWYDPERVVVTHEVSPPPLLIPEPTALLRITHDFHPSIVPRLYEIEVTVENLYYQPIKPRYRRLVDWDIQPSEFNEYVTIEYGPSTAVVSSLFYGFVSPDPLVSLGGGTAPTTWQSSSGRGICGLDTEGVDCGPGDLGAALDFEFPQIPPGGKLRFWLYYGAAPTEAGALALLDEVGASAYTLGQSAMDGTPMTFALGFKAPWAILDNGSVEIGVDMFGALNVHGGTPSAGSILVSAPNAEGPPPPPPITGLRDVGTNFESLAGGTPWEGWGLNVGGTPLAGTVSLVAPDVPLGPVDSRGSPPDPALGYGMSPLDFDVLGTGALGESVGRRAIVRTVVGDPPVFHVTHDFKPSKMPGLYEIVVILENVSGVDLPPTLYRRIADWNIEPTPFDEYVTHLFDSPAVYESVDSGQNSPIPYDWMVPVLCLPGQFVQCGPADLGMGYTFTLDAIPAGGREQFHLFYGSGPDPKTLYDTLLALGVGAMSIAEPNLIAAPIPEALTPVVFGFGFKDVLFVDDFETGDSTRWSATVPTP